MSVKSFIKHAAATAAFVMAGTASAAVTVNLGTLGLGTFYLTGSGASSSPASIIGVGDYDYTFTIAAEDASTVTFLSFAATHTLTDASSTVIAATPAASGAYVYSLGSGAYTLSVSVPSVAQAQFLTFYVGPDIPPVPEASSVAMTLAGLGVVGLMARRRKSA